jgi:hypothetical protein
MSLGARRLHSATCRSLRAFFEGSGFAVQMREDFAGEMK